MKVLLAIFTATLLAFSGAANAFHFNGHFASANANSSANTAGGSIGGSAGIGGSGGRVSTSVNSGAWNDSGAGATATSHSPTVSTYGYTDGGSYVNSRTRTNGAALGVSGAIGGYSGAGAARANARHR